MITDGARYCSPVEALPDEIDRIAEQTNFSGVVRIDRGDRTEVAKAYGMAHRALQVPNTIDTQFGTASAVKGLTALAVISLVVEGSLELSTTARSVLGDDLPLIDDSVTVEHLLSNRSGIGDYLDEDTDLDIAAYPMPVPVQHLATTEQYLAVLDGFPTKFRPDERFSYCNGGFVVLALIAERVSGIPFPDLVHQRVCEPAGMIDTSFLRSDELPGRAALGYVEMDGVWRTNVFHLGVRGSGDGGIYTTLADVRSFWPAFFGGRIVPLEWVSAMLTPRSETTEESFRYGLGFWLDETGDAVMLQGCDAGVSFRTWHHPATLVTHTVISNTAYGAWPITRRLHELLTSGAR
jgi:CubicO group peptidase (beta-lactamase class C family)